MKTNLILGPPGTGKTTFLISKIKEYLKAGYRIGQIAYVSFTKAAVSEAVNRCYEEFPELKKKDFVYFRTLHSFAFMEAGLNKNSVLSNEKIKLFEEVMGDNGYEIRYNFNEDCYENVRNIPIYLNHIAENKLENVEEIYRKGSYDVSLNTIKHVLASYKEFKNYYQVLDFNDMLKFNFQPIYPVKIVFLDEAQDLTPLQWETFYRMFGQADICFIAGDDCQAIYEWCGVDVNRFLGVEYDSKTVLSKSYRLPVSVYNKTEEIRSRIKHQFAKDFFPNDKGGTVSYIQYLDDVRSNLKNGSWLFLARNNYLLNKLNEWLLGNGIPFLYNGKSIVDKDHVSAILTWERQRKQTGEKRTWFQAFTHLDLDVSNYYREILRSGFKLTELPKIEITTIHKAKGREADNIVLLTDFSKACEKLVDAGEDCEHRVFYVGASRARENLFILEPFTNNYYAV